jgi:hypothetical protein
MYMESVKGNIEKMDKHQKRLHNILGARVDDQECPLLREYLKELKQ